MSFSAGTWGNGSIGSLTSYNKIKPYITGFFLRLNWAALETAPGVFNWSYIETQVSQLVSDGKKFGIMIMVSPNSSGYTPSWLTSSPYNVPIVYTSTPGVSYPYYFNTTFKSRKQMMLDALVNRIKNTWIQSWKDALVFLECANGSTGDEFPYSGIPLNSSYIITDDDWNNYQRDDVFTQLYAQLNADIPYCKLLINPANNGLNWQWGLDNIDETGLKTGFPTHTYNICGESFYSIRVQGLTAILPINLVRGELEKIINTAWFMESYKQNLFAVIASYIHFGGVLFCLTIQVINQLIDINNPDDFWAFEFANEFLGIRNVAQTDRAFILFRDQIDGADTTRFPTGTYGTFISSANQATYDFKYNQIITSGLPQSVQDDKIVKLGAQYFNSARQSALDAAFPNATFLPLSTDEAQDAYHQCFGLYMIPGNYSKYITQYDQDNTSTGFWNIGSTDDFHGKFCRSGAEISCAFDTGLVGNNSYTVTFYVWYYNAGTNQWSLNYWNGSIKTNAGTVVCTNTNAWVKHTFSISDFYGGGNLTNSTDWTLKTESGSDTKFDLVKFIRVSQNSGSIAPTADAGSDIFATLPTTTVNLDGSGSVAGSGTITGYLWELIDGDSCTITDPTNVTTTVTGLTEGARTFRLTVTNSDSLTDSNTVNVYLSNPFAPTANAGSDQVLPAGTTSTTLSGSGTGSGITYLWEQVSGASCVITDPTSATTTVTGLQTGTYIFKLTVTDNS